jgi:prevent-host-death family protein
VVEHVFVADANHDPNLKGNVAELAIAAQAAQLGLTVLRPMTEHERFDLVLGIAGQLLRTQCKWASRDGDVIVVRTRSSRYSPSRGYIRSNYTPDEIDLIAAWCQDLGRCYLLPIENFQNQGLVHLRLAPPRNRQRAALNFADQYELGAVAQLAERAAGSRQVGGSSPPSSTSQGNRPEVVGAHQFRNRFGWYMERAAAGEHFRVTRHGRPFVRLLPAQEPADQLSTAPIRLPMKRR